MADNAVRKINVTRELDDIENRLSAIHDHLHEIHMSQRRVKLALAAKLNKGVQDEIIVWLGPQPEEEA